MVSNILQNVMLIPSIIESYSVSMKES